FFLFDLRVVARDHFLEGTVNLVKEKAELDLLVAENVRAGSPATLQLAQCPGDNALLVLALQWHNLEGNFGLLADGADILQVIFPGTISKESQLFLEPNL